MLRKIGGCDYRAWNVKLYEVSMGMSEDEAKRLLKDKYPEPEPKRRAPKRKSKKKIAPVKRKGDQKMTETEKEYASTFLEPLVRSGDLLRYDYEKKKFVLADRCEYTPDFYCVYSTHIEVVEVKGGYANNRGKNARDGRTRWKVAAEENPEFVWKYATKKEDGSWHVEEYV